MDAFGCHNLSEQQIKKVVLVAMEVFFVYGDLASMSVATEAAKLTGDELNQLIKKLQARRSLRKTEACRYS
jgi:hypothetical protein